MRPVLVLALLAAVTPAAAQVRVHGVVVDATGGAPLEQTRVTGPERQVTTTDRFGRFTVVAAGYPLRLVVARIGYAPDTLELDAQPEGIVRVELRPRPVQVSEIVVTTGGADPGLADLGRWTVPVAEGVVPAAVAPDLFRDLAIVPGVTQSTILSARPIVRGYDAGEVTLRLDGFELPNPYHIARAFSSIPVEAAERVSVATAPLDVTLGGTSGAAVDIVGRVGETGGAGGGAALTPITLDAWAEGGTDGITLFGAGRAATVGTIARMAGKEFSYGFKDGYGSLLGLRRGVPWLRLTGFASEDHVDDTEGGDAMRWGVGLLGVRADLWRRGAQRLELSAQVTDFHETVDHLQIRGAFVDVRNEFGRAGGGVEWGAGAAQGRAVVGMAAARRRIDNDVRVSGGSLVPAALRSTVTEVGAYGAVSRVLGTTTIDLGLRYDGAGPVGAWQPRIRGEIRLDGGWSLGIGAGRSARLYHTVSDPGSEPELVFYDLWFVAGEDGIPVALVDHAMLSLGWGDGRFSFRSALYGSRGEGMVEVRPETDQSPGGGALRIGDSRTCGLELQGGVSGTGRSLTVTYTLSWSERDWGEGWLPWIQDRRHLVRVAAQTSLGTKWRLNALAEGMSAAPLTPVEYVVPVEPIYVYGRENSARGSGTFRLDLGVERAFQGPWGSNGTFTASVTNLTFGPVAPLAPEDPTGLYPTGGPTHAVRYVRMFDFPAVPTIGVRLEF